MIAVTNAMPHCMYQAPREGVRASAPIGARSCFGFNPGIVATASAMQTFRVQLISFDSRGFSHDSSHTLYLYREREKVHWDMLSILAVTHPSTKPIDVGRVVKENCESWRTILSAFGWDMDQVIIASKKSVLWSQRNADADAAGYVEATGFTRDVWTIDFPGMLILLAFWAGRRRTEKGKDGSRRLLVAILTKFMDFSHLRGALAHSLVSNPGHCEAGVEHGVCAHLRGFADRLPAAGAAGYQFVSELLTDLARQAPTCSSARSASRGFAEALSLHMHAVADELGLQRGGLATDARRVMCGRRRRWETMSGTSCSRASPRNARRSMLHPPPPSSASFRAG